MTSTENRERTDRRRAFGAATGRHRGARRRLSFGSRANVTLLVKVAAVCRIRLHDSPARPGQAQAAAAAAVGREALRRWFGRQQRSGSRRDGSSRPLAATRGAWGAVAVEFSPRRSAGGGGGLREAAAVAVCTAPIESESGPRERSPDGAQREHSHAQSRNILRSQSMSIVFDL